MADGQQAISAPGRASGVLETVLEAMRHTTVYPEVLFRAKADQPFACSESQPLPGTWFTSRRMPSGSSNRTE